MIIMDIKTINKSINKSLNKKNTWTDKLFLYREEKHTLRGKVIAFEGGIASGKSTMCSLLANDMKNRGEDVHVFLEYVDPGELDNFIIKNNLFVTRNRTDITDEDEDDDMTYDNFGASLQLSILQYRYRCLTEAHQYKEANPNTIIILDRSFIGDFAFSYMGRKRKNGRGEYVINNTGWALITEWIIDNSTILKKPDLIIFLDCNGDISRKRCDNRGNMIEKKYQNNYFQKVINAYKTILNLYDHVKIDWNKSIDDTTKLTRIYNVLINYYKLVRCPDNIVS